MSSSRRNSRTETPPTGPCPTCGSRRVIAVEEEVVLTIGHRRHRFERVPHERCLACGERVFGIEASRRFDAAALRKQTAGSKGATQRRGAGAAPPAADGRSRLARPTLDAIEEQVRARRASRPRRVEL